MLLMTVIYTFFFILFYWFWHYCFERE